MEPRKSTSLVKNKTRLPDDALDFIKEGFQDEFKAFLKDKNLYMEGYLYLEEILFRFGFKDPNAIRQHNFECSLDYNSQNTKEVMDMIYFGVDALESMLSQYIEADGDIEFPMDWKEFRLEKKPIWLRYSTVNSELEAQADALLGDDFLNKEKEALDETFVDQLFAALRQIRH